MLSQVHALGKMLVICLLLLAGTDVVLADVEADAGMAYQRGDYATAAVLYRLLAEQGDPQAQFILGNMYDMGQGVPRSTIEANKWWYRAAVHGNADASRKFQNISCQKLYPTGRGALPGVDCLNADVNNGDLLPKASQTAVPNMPAPTPDQSTTAAAERASSRLELPLKRQQGTFTLPIEINGQMTLDFVIDSGAAFVTVPADVFGKLREVGAIQESDLRGIRRLMLADGSLRESMTFTIRSLRVGNELFESIQGAVVPVGGKLLLGQTFLQRFKSWSLDNIDGKLVLELPTAADWWPIYRNQITGILLRNQSEEGTAIVTFTLDRDGHLTERHIVRSTGSFTLDQAILGLLDRSQPFPPFPAANLQKELTMTFPISFAIGPITK